MDLYVRTRQFFILMVLVALLGGFWLSALISGKEDVTGSEQELSTSRVAGNTVALDPMTQVTAEIVKIKDNVLSIRMAFFGDASLSPSFYERSVRVDEETRITNVGGGDSELRKKEMESFQSEMERFNKGEIPEAPTLPALAEPKEGTLADLQVGQDISIRTIEDMRLRKEFVARAIDILPPTQ